MVDSVNHEGNRRFQHRLTSDELSPDHSRDDAEAYVSGRTTERCGKDSNTEINRIEDIHHVDQSEKREEMSPHGEILKHHPEIGKPKKPAAGESTGKAEHDYNGTNDGYGETWNRSTETNRTQGLSDQSEESKDTSPDGHVSNGRSMERCREDSAREIEIEGRIDLLCDQSEERQERKNVHGKYSTGIYN